MLWLAIDQFGNKTILPDIKYSTLREVFYAGSIRKQYTEMRDGSNPHTGYVLGQGRGNVSLWITLYRIFRMDEEVVPE